MDKVDNRRQVYLSLVSEVESQLRDAYAERNDRGEETQTSLANKLGVNRSVINRRLRGLNNLTLETIADMVWGLGRCIKVEIFDPHTHPTNHALVISEHSRTPPAVVSSNQHIRFDEVEKTSVVNATNKKPLNILHDA